MIGLVAALLLYSLTWVAVGIGALVAGGRWERLAFAGFLVAVAATHAAKIPGRDWNGVEYGVLAVDVVFLGYLIWIARRSPRWWPIWAAAAQGAAVISHLSAGLIPHFPRTWYLTLQPAWAFPLLISIAVGVSSEYRARGVRAWALNQKR